MDIVLECALQSKEHARPLFAWRSDPETRAQSLHQSLTSFDDFWPYFTRVYFLLKDLPPLFARVEGERVSFVGFDPMSSCSEKAARISIVVAPEVRGKGIGTEVLKKAATFAKQQGYKSLYAEIKPDNQASRRAFEKAGYSFVSDIKREVEGKVVPLQLFKIELGQEIEQKPLFIIAEAGSNWRMGDLASDLKMAKNLIEAAHDAGCDAIKFQVYRPETVYVANAGSADYMQEMGIQQSVTDVFKELSMPYEMIPTLAEICKKSGIEFMATPFSKADFLAVDPYVLCHKIGSYELGHVRLLELAARSQKPLLLSTGVSDVEDIEWAVSYYKKLGGKDITLLQCCAQYPAKSSGMNIRAIPWMQQYFQLPVGLSDHSPDPLVAPVGAVALGACVVEKHFTIDRRLPGPDHSFAIEPHELKAMVQACRMCEEMRGSGIKQIEKEEEELYRFARRGIQAITAIKKGDIFVEDDNIAILRPGKQKRGSDPRYIDEIVGKQAMRDIKLGEGIEHDDFK